MIRYLGDPILRRWAHDATSPDASLESDLVKALYTYDGLAISAPQIGELLRVFVYDLRDGKGVQTIYNPVLTNPQGSSFSLEGCLSIPGFSRFVERAEKIQVRGRDCNWNEVSFSATDLLARCMQHEVDHLDGRLYIDLLSPFEREELMESFKRYSFQE